VYLPYKKTEREAKREKTSLERKKRGFNRNWFYCFCLGIVIFCFWPLIFDQQKSTAASIKNKLQQCTACFLSI